MKIENTELFIVNDLPVSISVDLKQGLYLLLGDNGIGKTTFFNYLKENRENLSPKSHFAFMDQFPLSAINEIRLKDILVLLKSGSANCDVERANDLILRYEVEYLMERPVIFYSGGENQIIKFILLMCQNVDYYFLDEPLQYIDKKRVALLKEDIAELSLAKTVVVIEHRADELQELRSNLITMERNDSKVTINGY
jgi:ABC-type multidrug transport system ATPase subunit